MMKSTCDGLRIGAVAVLAAVAAIGPALANGGSGGSGGGGGGSSGTRSLNPRLACPSGWELKVDPQTSKPKCVRASSGLEQELPAVGWNDADPAFVEAAVLAHSGAYEQAIAAFTALDRPEDPYVLNYLGYSNRKLGRTDAALAYYQKALSIRPDYVRVREYMGEGFIALGRIDEAREQLALIGTECGTDCDEYRKLDAAIAEYLAESSG